MSEGDTERCMNCFAAGDIRAADAPNGHRYWVCGECEKEVELGEARCVWRPNRSVDTDTDGRGDR